jgi:hypothetical protein
MYPSKILPSFDKGYLKRVTLAHFIEHYSSAWSEGVLTKVWKDAQDKPKAQIKRVV